MAPAKGNLRLGQIVSIPGHQMTRDRDVNLP